MAFANTLKIPYTIYGGLSTATNGGINTLSGFTCKLTSFRCIPTLTDPTFNYISSDNFIWDFGDGTRATTASASHVYNYPGVYNITLLAYDSGGNEHLSTEVKQVSVSDFWPDRLTIGGPSITQTVNIPSNIVNATQSPIMIERRNTRQLHAALSGDEYTVNLYASGSNSFDRSTMLSDKWLHLDKTWSFYEATTADNGKQQLNSITSIKTTSQDVYFRVYEKFQTQWIERVPLSALSTYPEAVFVGTSGTASFFYGDTLPILTDEPIFAFCTLDTSKVPEYRELLKGKLYNQLHANDIHFPTLHNRLELAIPLRVRYRAAKSLTFTSAGLKSLPFSPIKWQNIKSSFFVDLLDIDDNITMNYPDLSGKQAVSGTAISTDTFVTTLSVVSGNSAVLSASTATELLSANFYRNTEFSLPHSIDSKFTGTVIPYATGDNVHLVGECKLYTEPNFSKDTVMFGIVNRDTSELNIGKFHDVYVLGEHNISVSKDINFTKKPISDTFIVNPSIAYFHTASSYTDDSVMGFFCGTEIDSISATNTYTAITSTISLSTINDGVDSDIPRDTPDIVDKYHNGGSTKQFIPSYIGISKDRTAWITLSASGIVMEVSVPELRLNKSYTSPSPTVEKILRISENLTYNTVTGKVPDQLYESPIGTYSVFEPTIVDADISNNLWVGFTNPISGSVRKYNINANASDNAGVETANYDIFKIAVGPLLAALLDALVALYGSEQEVANRINETTGSSSRDNAIRIILSLFGYNLDGIIHDYKTSNNNQLAATITFDHKYTIPTDIITTNKGECWISTKDTDPGADTSLTVSTGTVSALSAGIDTIKYALSASVTNILPGHVINIEGFTPVSGYNGKFLVQARDEVAKIITVKPFRGKVNNLPSATAVTTTGKLTAWTDHVYKTNSLGTVTHDITGFYEPGYICTDKHQNLWVAHDVNTITKVTTAGEISTSIKVLDSSTTNLYASAGSAYMYTVSSDMLHLGGITFDTYDNMYVINSYEGRVYRIPVNNPTLSSSWKISDSLIVSTDNTAIMPAGRHVARGDWNGFRWLNKFDNTVGVSTVSGHVTVNIYPSGGKYAIAKINEDFDPIETVKSYRMQPVLVDNGKVLFDDLYGSAIGSISSAPDSLGRVTYEKIANFTDNISDPSTCNIKALYSMCEMTDLNITKYDFDYSGGLHRIMNLVSIPHKKLWGQRSRFDRDFETFGTQNSAYGINLGAVIDTSTYYVTAGVPIVARQLFNNQHKKVNTMYVSGATTNKNYAVSVSALSSYPLSSYNKAWGWGLGDNIDSSDISNYFTFYEFTPVFSDIQLEGVIDWNNSQTTISENISSYDDWFGDNKIADTLIDYELRRGLGLFNPKISAADTGIL